MKVVYQFSLLLIGILVSAHNLAILLVYGILTMLKNQCQAIFNEICVSKEFCQVIKFF
jgi:hypothetical protein